MAVRPIGPQMLSIRYGEIGNSMWRDSINQDALDRLIHRAKGETALVPFVGAGLSLAWSSLGWAAFLMKVAEKVAASTAPPSRYKSPMI
jgi:hypothetical protein